MKNCDACFETFDCMYQVALRGSLTVIDGKGLYE